MDEQIGGYKGRKIDKWVDGEEKKGGKSHITEWMEEYTDRQTV